MTPKSLLRLPAAASHIEDLTSGRFQPVLAEPGVDPEKVTRLLLCSGKVYYDIIGNAAHADALGVAIGRIELLYPFPEEEILTLINTYPNLARSSGSRRNRATWARAHTCRAPSADPAEHLEFGYVGRPERAASGEGYPAAHSREQNRIVTTALDLMRPISQYRLPCRVIGRSAALRSGDADDAAHVQFEAPRRCSRSSSDGVLLGLGSEVAAAPVPPKSASSRDDLVVAEAPRCWAVGPAAGLAEHDRIGDRPAPDAPRLPPAA